MTFYERYAELCRMIGKSPSAVATEIGVNKASASAWKNRNLTPRSETIRKLADYFGVSVDYLMGNTDEMRPKAFETKDPDVEIFEMIEMLKHPEIQKLLQRLINRPISDIDKMLDILDLLDKQSQGGF